MRQYWSLVRHNANFRRLWLAQLISEVADWFYSVAIYSLLLQLTGQAGTVAMAVVLQLLPQTLAGPTAGIVNDRVSRKKVMIAADIARAVIVLGMLLVRTPATVPLAYVLLFLETVMAAFFEPARSAAVPAIASERELLAANSLGSITWSFSLAIGASLGGAVAVLLGRDAVFLINAGSFVVSAILIGRTRFAEPHAEAAAPLRAAELVDFSPVLEGFRYIRANRRLFPTVFAKAGMGLLGANLVIIPILGQRVFPVYWHDASPERAAVLGMSLLMAMRGVGALIGPLIGGAVCGNQEGKMRRAMAICFVVAAAGYLTLSVAPHFAFASLCVVTAHAAASINWVFSSTLLQMHSEDRYRGRVFAADLGLLTASIAFSAYIAGRTIDAGVHPLMFARAIGVALLIPGTVWYFTNRRLS